MPKSHRDTMEVLFVFLKWVASFAHMDAETGSKMDLGNLATVIGPSILYSRGRDALRDETFGSLRVVTSLLENQDEFFLVPQDMLPILQDQEYFANALELPSKEFLKKVDMYMKVKGQGGRTPGAMTPYLGGSSGQGGMANGSPASRFAGSIPAAMPSPTMERPPPMGGERSGRPSPNVTPHPQQQQQQPGASSTSKHGHGGNGNGYFAGAAGPSSNDYQHPSGSPSMQHYVPQALLQQQQQQQQPQQRTPPMANADWSQPPPRPSGSNGTPGSSRPTSVAGNPPSRSFNNAGPISSSYTNTGPLSSSPMDSGLYGPPQANGYHPNAAVRQR